MELVADQQLAGLVLLLVERDVRRGVGVVALELHVVELLGEVALVVAGVDRGNLAGQRAAIHRVVFLDDGHRVAVARLLNGGAGGEVRGSGGADRIGIEAGVHADLADVAGRGLAARVAVELVLTIEALAVAEREDDGVFGLAEGNHHGDFDLGAVHLELDHRGGPAFAFAVGSLRAVPSFKSHDLVVDAHFLGGFRRDHRRVVPRLLCDRVRGFLQPTVVDPAAVVNRGVGGEDDVEGFIRRNGQGGHGRVRNLDLGDLVGGSGVEAFAEQLAPRLAAFAADRFEGLLHRVVGRRRFAFGAFTGDQLAVVGKESGKDFQLAGAVGVERQDHRLDDRVNAVGRAGVGPAFEIMAGRNVPGRRVGGGVGAGAEMDHGLRLGERLTELEIGRGIEQRIGRGEQDEGFDRTGFEVSLEGSQIAEALGVGADVAERLAFADVPEFRVDRMNHGVDFLREPRSGENQRLSFKGQEVIDHRSDPLVSLVVRNDRNLFDETVEFADANPTGDPCGDIKQLPRTHPQAVIRHAAGHREGALDRVKSVHPGGIRLGGVPLPFRLAAVEERGDRALRVERGEVAVNRQDAVGLREIGHGADPVAEDFRGASYEGFVGVEFRGGELGGQFFDQPGTGRRDIVTEDKADLGGLVGGECGDHRVELGAGRGLALLEDLLGARRRVEIEDGGLGEGIGAGGIRVQGVRGQFGRAAFEGGDDQRRGTGGARHAGGVVGRLARDDPLGRLVVGDDVAFRAAAGGHAEAGEGGRGAHQLEERTAGGFCISLVRHFGDSLRELALHPGAESGGVLELTDAAPGDGGLVGGDFGVLPDAFAHGRRGGREIRRKGRGRKSISGGRWRRSPWGRSSSAP